MPSTCHSSPPPPLSLLICAFSSSFVGSQGYQCPWLCLTSWLGWGLQPLPVKNTQATNEIRGRGRGGGYRRGRASGHGPDPSMLGGPTVQTSRVPRHQRGLPTGMTDAGESLREPCVLKGEGGPPSPTSDFRGCRCGASAADASPLHVGDDTSFP